MNGANEALRHAALTLHAMPQADRGWLLGQLTPGERAALQPLLQELAALGISADPAMLDDVRRAPSVGAAVLAQADPLHLAQLLAGEPELLVARLLHARDWPWQAALLAQWPAPRRQRIVGDLRQLQAQAAPAGKALAAALVTAVEAQLKAVPAALPDVTPRQPQGWWRRLRGENWGVWQ